MWYHFYYVQSEEQKKDPIFIMFKVKCLEVLLKNNGNSYLFKDRFLDVT